MSPLEITLVILLVTIIAFVSGKVPFSVISTGIILALILTGIKTPAEAFGGFINTNVVMFVAMFVIGAGLTKTPLIDKAQSLVIRYKDNMRMLIFLSCVAGAFLGAITSATATAAIMIPLLVGIANDIGVSRSKLLYPSMACANIATQMTFLGQGASNMAWNDVMMQAGAPTPLHIWDFTIARIPMLAIAILYMTFVGYKLMPDIPNEQFSDAAHTASESEKLSPFKRKLAVLIVLVSIAMMLLENVIGVKMYLTSCIGAAALVLTGVLTEREALNSIHQPTIFLFAGVLALSDAIQTTGAGDVVADWMIRLLGPPGGHCPGAGGRLPVHRGAGAQPHRGVSRHHHRLPGRAVYRQGHRPGRHPAPGRGPGHRPGVQDEVLEHRRRRVGADPCAVQGEV